MKGYGNLTNRVMENSKQLKPEVGMGATITMHSDRHACTITQIVSERMVVVQEDCAVRTDKNGMSYSQTYEYDRDRTGLCYTFSLRKNGRWVCVNESQKDGTGLVIGERDHYFDFSF